MTHAELVKHATQWLRSAKRCNPVFSERGSMRILEMPDAIGFTPHETIVVECKIFKSDLQADKKKPHRQNGGLGNRRYYLLPRELYEQCKEYDWAGWGVLVYTKHYGVKQARLLASAEFHSDLQAERHFLRSRVLEIQNFGR